MLRRHAHKLIKQNAAELINIDIHQCQYIMMTAQCSNKRNAEDLSAVRTRCEIRTPYKNTHHSGLGLRCSTMHRVISGEARSATRLALRSARMGYSMSTLLPKMKLVWLSAMMALYLVMPSPCVARTNTTTFMVNGGGDSPIYYLPSTPVTLFQESPRGDAPYKTSFRLLADATLTVVDGWVADNTYASFVSHMDDRYNLTITLSSELPSKLSSIGGCFDLSRDFFRMYFDTIAYHMESRYSRLHASDTCNVLDLHFAPKA